MIAAARTPAGASRPKTGSPRDGLVAANLDGTKSDTAAMLVDADATDEKAPSPNPPPSALRSSSGFKPVLDTEALASLVEPRFRHTRPLNAKGELICTVSSKHQDKAVSPTVKVHSDIKLVFAML